ncbi:protein cordon-bleu isoform X2 [Ictalurus punctatus]|nr:protein cordon-bleu isoform X2 [Ictalurus punctatus]
MPAVCDKCEMDPKITVLLRDSQSEEPLDLTKTLNDYGIRDLYAKAVSSSPTDSATLTNKDCKKDKLAMQEKVLGEKENSGLLGLFRRSRKSAEETATNTTPISTATSLVLKDQRANNTGCSSANSASSTASSEMTKKRRAPQPPSMLGSRSVSCELNSSQQSALPSTDNENQGVLSRASSSESSLRRNKRRAPPPPRTSPSLPDTSDKERSYTGSFLEDAEEDNSTEASFNQSSYFKSTCLSFPSSPLMAEVLAEFTHRMKTMEQNDVSFDWSVTHSPLAPPTLPPVSEYLDGDPVVPPGCELLRNGSQRDGLTTFTVVPRRRPQSMRQYEVLLTMENSETMEINGDTGENLEGGISESREIEKTEMGTKEIVMLERTDAESENLEETNKELGITEAFGELKLNMDTEKHLPEGRDKMEVQDERDWIEQYREIRMRFLSDDDHDGKEAKLKTSTKVFDEEMVDDVPPPQLSVCWEEEDTETQNLEETDSFGKEEVEEDKAANTFTIQNPNPSRYDPHHDPTYDASYTQDPYWDVNLSSNQQSSNSDTPFTSSSQSNPQTHQPNSVQSTLPHVSKSKLNPSFELSSPNSASLFGLAVSQRVQSLGNDIFPLIPSARRTSSPTPHPQSVGSPHTSSQKLYFQNLISQEFISKIPASPGSCSEALPTFTAPPSVIMTTQARRRAWSSFSRTKLKNLEPI